jgi:hypothetical protein
LNFLGYLRLYFSTYLLVAEKQYQLMVGAATFQSFQGRGVSFPKCPFFFLLVAGSSLFLLSRATFVPDTATASGRSRSRHRGNDLPVVFTGTAGGGSRRGGGAEATEEVAHFLGI